MGIKLNANPIETQPPENEEYYFKAYERFLRYAADTYKLGRRADITGRHLSGYIKNMKNRGLSSSEIKSELAGIRFWHGIPSNA